MKLFIRNIRSALIGISFELFFVYFVIFAGFLVSLIWWLILK